MGQEWSSLATSCLELLWHWSTKVGYNKLVPLLSLRFPPNRRAQTHRRFHTGDSSQVLHFQPRKEMASTPLDRIWGISKISKVTHLCKWWNLGRVSALLSAVYFPSFVFWRWGLGRLPRLECSGDQSSPAGILFFSVVSKPKALGLFYHLVHSASLPIQHMHTLAFVIVPA